MAETRIPAMASAIKAKFIAQHWRLYLIEGLVLVVLGTAAILMPQIAGLVTTIYFGWLFLIGGSVSLVTTLLARHAIPGFFWSLLSAALAIAAGIFLIGWPNGGAFSLTSVLTLFLIADGIVSIVLAIEHQRHLLDRWSWLLLNGMIDFLLAGLIAWGLPEISAWVLGLILGIDLIFGGTSLIGIALAVRRPIG